MPKIQWPISDTDQTVSRPVMLDVIQQMKQYTNLGDEVPILYTGPDGQTYQPGSSLESADSVTNQVRGSMYSQLQIEVDEKFQHDAFLTTPVEHPEHLFIFRDDYLYTYLKPGYDAMDVSINIKYRAADKPSAERWIQQLKNKIGRGHLVNLHTVTYSYFIPPVMLAILEEIHRLRENVAPYGDTWDTYFKQTVSEKATQVANLAGRNLAWVMAESQMRVEGTWDVDGAPEKGSREGGGETWTITASYKFQYHRPSVVWMQYPLMIHNQLLDQKFRPESGPYEVEKQERAYQWSTDAFAHFEKGRVVQQIHNREGYELPAFDEWLPDDVQPNTRRLASVMLYIDPAQPRLLFDVTTDLAPYKMDEEVLQFLLDEAPYVTTPRASIFNISVYRWGQMMDGNTYAMDNTGKVSMNWDLNLRDNWHIRISLFKDISKLTSRAQTALQSHCGAAIKCFDAIDPTLKHRGLLPSCIMPGNWLPKPGLGQVGDTINSGTISKGNGQTYRAMRTVGTGTIIAHRELLSK